MQKLLTSVLVLIGEKIIDIVAKYFQQWLKEKRIEKEVKDAMAKKNPADRARALGNEL